MTYASRLVYDDGQRREPELFQQEFVRAVFRRDPENLLLLPEGCGKTTLIALLALYGCDWAPRPWIPVGAASRDQARIVYQQAKSFITSTPGLARRFKPLDGYRVIRPLDPRTGKPRPGRGIEVYAADVDTADGVIPWPYYVIDEVHRLADLGLWRLWRGKSRKRGAQGIGISTAGEPGSEFEEWRDRIRQRATSSRRRHGGTLYRGGGTVMYEFKLADPAKATDPKAVAKVNPLSKITADMLAEDLASPSLDIGHWKRVKCNIAARSSHAAITDGEWLKAAAPEEAIPEGERVDLGADTAWKWDTFAIAPLWRGPDYHLLDEATVLVPPRDGTSLHPDRVKEAFLRLAERNPIDSIVMDVGDAEDIAAWLEDELGVAVVDRQQSVSLAVLDFNNFTRGLRNGELRRVKRCPQLTSHVMNAIARRLPGGDYRFDRPVQSRNAAKQDRRVIDALSAAGFVYTNAVATVEQPAKLVNNVW